MCSPVDENIPTLSLRRVCEEGDDQDEEGSTERNIPFFGEDLVESPRTGLGATIFTAALADCGLVKKAMIGRVGQKKGTRRRVRVTATLGQRHRHPAHRDSLDHVLSRQGCCRLQIFSSKRKHHLLALQPGIRIFLTSRNPARQRLWQEKEAAKSEHVSSFASTGSFVDFRA
jgi:hypothetical protein